MAPKKPTENPNKKRKATLDSVLSTVKRGFADLEGKMDRGFAAVADDILDDLREKVENVSGFQKEIDHALERIAAIEKHLGLDKKIAA